MFQADSLGKITVRNLQPSICSALAALANQRDRSVEAEARRALSAWVEPYLQEQARSTRLARLSQSLRYLQEEIDLLPGVPKATVSRVAQRLGSSHAVPVERWFIGEDEPSFADLANIARLLGCSENWLMHGEGEPFPSRFTRLPENALGGADLLLEPEDPGEKLVSLCLVRSQSTTGEFAFVKRFTDWRAQLYSTPYHISEEIGAGGEAGLAWLTLSLEAVYARWSGHGSPAMIAGYLVPEDVFAKLLSGKHHPLRMLRDADRSTWWEDIWDEKQFGQMSYWPGWDSLVVRIRNVIAARPGMRR